MGTSWFFKSSWIFQLLVGVGLFLCSFFIEYKILQAFLAPTLMALCLAISLEIGKVTAIVWHYYMSHLSASTYPGSVRFTSLLFRSGLVIFSLICSLLFLNDRLDRPHLERIKAAEEATIEKRLKDDLAGLDARYRSRKEAMDVRHQTENEELTAVSDQTIAKLEALLLAEMDNVVGGAFKGPRYLELEQRLSREKAARQKTVKELRRRQTEEIVQLESNFRQLREEALSTADEKQRQIVAQDFSTDERVNDPYIVAFLKVTDSLFTATPAPPQFVCLFSLLISLLMETGIVLAFSTITVSMAPVLEAQLEAAVEQEVLMTRMAREAKRDEMAHQAAMDRVTKASKRTIKKAQASRQAH